MKIGIISDTHDDGINLKKVARIFRNEKIEEVYHLGDYVSPPLIKILKDFRLTGIFGNSDGNRTGLMDAFNEIGGNLAGDFAAIEADGLKIALYHGEYRQISEALAKSGNYDAVFCGHLHKSEKTSFGKTLLLSPGSTHGYLTRESSPTFGIFNTQDMEFEILSI
ncbi:MAG: phosphodiesterase [Actinobacteria bacterium ADurb.Bin346]|nr:MAG: phosphodiesterase [Actinobacteria bacterium ADurb.Bin346]